MEFLTNFLLGLIGNLLASDLDKIAPIVAKRVIDSAVRRLPETERERYAEEWRAHLDECHGSIWKISHAVGCYFGTAGMIAAMPKVAPARLQTERARVGATRETIILTARKIFDFGMATAVGVVEKRVVDPFARWFYAGDRESNIGVCIIALLMAELCVIYFVMNLTIAFVDNIFIPFIKGLF